MTKRTKGVPGYSRFTTEEDYFTFNYNGLGLYNVELSKVSSVFYKPIIHFRLDVLSLSTVTNYRAFH